MSELKILGIVGSLRRQSFNLQLSKAAAEELEGRAAFSLLDYSKVPLLNQDEEIPAPEPVAKAREQVMAANGLWFFTPEYNHFFPGVLKNLIDWLSRPIDADHPQVLIDKPVAISGITPGMSGTALSQDHLVTLLSFLQADIMNSPRLTIPSAFDLMDGGQLDLSDNRKRIKRQADAFLAFVEKRTNA